MLVGNAHGMRFRRFVAENSSGAIAVERASLDRFYIVQLALFLVIILVSVIGPPASSLPDH